MLFDLQQLTIGRWHVLSVVGDVDLAVAPTFRAAVAQAAANAAAGGHGLAIDLASCDFLDSVGLGILLGGLRRQRDQDLPFAVVATGRTAALLRRVRIDEIVTVVPGRDDLGGGA